MMGPYRIDMKSLTLFRALAQIFFVGPKNKRDAFPTHPRKLLTERRKRFKRPTHRNSAGKTWLQRSGALWLQRSGALSTF